MDRYVANPLKITISVIIPALNELDSIESCIASAQAAGADQIIVVDGGSEDGTRQLLDQLDGIVVDCDPGRGRQMQVGANHATGTVLLFLHADTRLSTDCLEQIRRVVRESTDAWGCFQQRIAADGRRYRWLEQGNNWRARVRKLPYGDQAIWVTRSVYQQVGGIPDEPLMEDVILVRRLRKRSTPVMLPGPVTITDRHWQRRGVVGTTVRNWCLLGLYRCGIPPGKLVRLYR